MMKYALGYGAGVLVMFLAWLVMWSEESKPEVTS